MPNLLTARRLALWTLLGAAAVACGDDNSENQDDSRPTAIIDAPLESETWAAGDLIEFSGHATDPEDGSLPGASLTWWAELHHDTHSHPFMAVQSGASGSVTLPTTGETSDNVWYRFYLRAVDATGQADTVYVEIFPRKATLTVTATGTGREITLDAQPHDAPYTVLSVVGMERVIGAPSPQVAVDSTWSFSSWSDGGAQSHTIVMPEHDTTFTASFTGTGPGNTPPVVTLTGPAADTTVTANTTVNLLATATDADGTVLAVDFRDGPTVIGTDSAAPYTYAWTPTINGAHTITARATDDDGSVTTSGSRTITVTGGSGSDTEAPTIAWTEPEERSPNLNGVVNLAANATDNVGVVGVEFRIDGVTLGEDLSAPYSFSLSATTPYTSGSHFFQARSRDAAGNVSAWAVRHVTFDGSVDVPDGFSRAVFASGLSDRGTAMALAPDGRIFVCQQNGQLRVVKNGALLATPFVSLTVNNNSERGLLGVAFDPNYANNRYVYVYYTTNSAPIHNRVSRFTASAGNQDVAEAGSELQILNLPQLSAGNHNGGAIHFGADGKLYVAVGDNANGANSQTLNTRLGKMLRINSDGGIPTDNPFYAMASDSNRAIWAMGLRNPFTFAFQPGTGRMHINDVGEGTWEEINLGQAGKNYGWPGEEGRATNPVHEPPIFTYKHSQGTDNLSMMTGFVITGGAFYNPPTVMFPAHYVGSYFFADLESHWIGRLDLSSGEAHHFARNTETVDMVVGTDGALYTLSNTGGSWGVFRYSRP
jgi:glucose/arabinose dehydrogenase